MNGFNHAGRNAFERYIPEVIAACATINKKINRDALGRNLNAVAKRVTARADEVLDDHGRPIKKGPVAAESDYGTNTVVVDPNAPPTEKFQLAS